MDALNGKKFRHIAIQVVLILFAATCWAAQPAEKFNQSQGKNFAPSICEDSPSDFRCSNLLFFSPDLWIALRFDAQDSTMVAAVSDRDGVGLWDSKQVFVSVDSEEHVIFKARTVLRSFSNIWVDWIDWKITVDKDGNAKIEETNPDRKMVFDGKALPIATFTSHKFP